MCVIFSFMPGVLPEYSKFENAVYNNPHGFGLVLRDPKYNRLQVIKSSEEELITGVDPKKLYSLLEEHNDIERYLHVRWRTEGSISTSNVQPFCAFNSDKRQVYFMHNGTLNDYRPTSVSSYYNGVKVDAGEQESDTKKFNDTFLSPFLSRFKGESGIADIKDPVSHSIISKFWGIATHNRGLLISSDQGAVLINKSSWETIKNEDGSEYLASNKDYFDTLKRGFHYEALKKEKEEREAAERKERQDRFQNTFKSLTELKQVDFTKKIDLRDTIKELLHDVDIYQPEGIAALKNLTPVEIQTFVEKNEDDVTALMIHVTDEFAKLLDKYDKLKDFVQKIKNGEARVG